MMKTGMIVFVLYMTGCAYDPVYEGTHCGPGLACPEGYTCGDITKTCTKTSEEPTSQDGHDAGQTDDSIVTDNQPDAADKEILDAGDTFIDGDDILDGQDSTGDEGVDDSPADMGPCGGCPSNQWCDLQDNNCKPCNDPLHCGPSCQECQDGQTCSNISDNAFCCLGTCDYSTACFREQCGSDTWICKASFNPLSYLDIFR